MITIKDILDSHHTRRPIVMGILNVTPDSFSDGGQFDSPSAAVDQARRMLDEGADVIDIGAESTRPGSERIDAQGQIQRLQEVLPALVKAGAMVSMDTTLAAVAAYALDTGAAIINDIAAGRDDAEMLPLAASRGCPIVLMHMLGQPRTMQKSPQYSDVVAEVGEFLSERVEAAIAAGVRRENIILDPGIGFGKTMTHNLELLARVDELAALGLPVLVGASRKRFIGEITGANTPADRVYGTVAAHVAAYLGGATIIRVHDVAAARQSLDVAAAIAARG